MAKHHHWTDDLFTMTCVVCGAVFTKFYEATAHVETHPRPRPKTAEDKKEDPRDNKM